MALACCAIVCTAQDVSSESLLTKIQQKVAAHLERLPNYVCTEVIQRFERGWPSQDMRRIDTVRVEVAVIDGHERFAWPDSTDYQDMDLGEMVGNSSGGIAAGDFVLHARNIFVESGTAFGEVQKTDLEGRATIRIPYRVPAAESTYLVWSNGRSRVTGYHGDVWVDASTLDLVRVAILTDDLPEPSRIVRASSTIDYASMRLGESVFILPKHTQLSMTLVLGKELVNRTEFTSYRRYQATSSVSFEPPADFNATATGTFAESALPPGLRLNLKLDSIVDSEHAAVGDRVYARTVQPVVARGRTVLPRGTRVSGRIRKLERHFEPSSYYIVGLEFSEAEIPRGRAHFRGQMEEVQLIPGMMGTPSVSPAVEAELVRSMPLGPPQIPNTGIFVVIGNRVVLPQGLRLRWNTVEVKN